MKFACPKMVTDDDEDEDDDVTYAAVCVASIFNLLWCFLLLLLLFVVRMFPSPHLPRTQNASGAPDAVAYGRETLPGPPSGLISL